MKVRNCINLKSKFVTDKIRGADILKYISLTLYTVVEFDTRTSSPFLTMYSARLIQLACLIGIIDMLMLRKISKKQMFLLLTVSAMLVVDALPSGLHALMYLFVIIWMLRDTEIERFLKYEFMLTLFLTGLVLMLTACGVYENIIMSQVLNGNIRNRYSLGFSSWTILPFQYLALVMVYMYFKKESISYKATTVLWIIGYIIYKFTDTKSAFIYLSVFLILCYSMKFIHTKIWRKCGLFISAMPWILAFGSYLCVYLYNHDNLFIKSLDYKINRRLYYTSVALEIYKIRFLSNLDIEWSSEIESYLIVDNSYINIALRWGILGLFLVLFIYSYLLYFACRTNNGYLLLIIMTILLIAIMWDRLLVFPDVEIILLFANFFSNKNRLHFSYG